MDRSTRWSYELPAPERSFQWPRCHQRRPDQPQPGFSWTVSEDEPVWPVGLVWTGWSGSRRVWSSSVRRWRSLGWRGSAEAGAAKESFRRRTPGPWRRTEPRQTPVWKVPRNYIWFLYNRQVLETCCVFDNVVSVDFFFFVPPNLPESWKNIRSVAFWWYWLVTLEQQTDVRYLFSVPSPYLQICQTNRALNEQPFLKLFWHFKEFSSNKMLLQHVGDCTKIKIWHGPRPIVHGP